jgi:hypothetical protein
MRKWNASKSFHSIQPSHFPSLTMSSPNWNLMQQGGIDDQRITERENKIKHNYLSLRVDNCGHRERHSLTPYERVSICVRAADEKIRLASLYLSVDAFVQSAARVNNPLCQAAHNKCEFINGLEKYEIMHCGDHRR